MAKDLKKFVNPKFLRTCDLKLMRRLLAPHKRKLVSFDLATLDGDPEAAREALGKFFEGPESGYPAGLKADLHRIEELGTRNGLRLLIERAKAMDVVLIRQNGATAASRKPDAKYVSMLCFLDHRTVFDAASDLLAIQTKVALTEFRGIAGETAAALDAATKKAFEEAAKRLLSAEFQGHYCRVGWYQDDGEINVVVVHGMDFTTELVIEEGQETVISFQPAGTAVLSYDPVQGRLKVGGLAKAQRDPFAEIFATTMLARPGFFACEDAQQLYTLAPIEKAGFEFAFDHQFDPGIRSVRVVEAQADRVGGPNSGKPPKRQWSVLVSDGGNALRRMEQATKVTFPAYRLAHLALRIEFDSETKPNPRVSVKVVPPKAAQFKRHVFEGRVLELLRRNGLTIEREPDRAAVAAE